MTTRREFLKGATAVMALPVIGAAGAAFGRARKPLDILFLGGTGFLGPHQVEYALAQGHRVTLFNRGRSAPGMFGDRAEILIGNRDAKIDAGLSALQGTRKWDAGSRKSCRINSIKSCRSSSSGDTPETVVATAPQRPRRGKDDRHDETP